MVKLVDFKIIQLQIHLIENALVQVGTADGSALLPNQLDSARGLLDSALSLAHSLQGDFQVPITLQAREFLSPLYQ